MPPIGPPLPPKGLSPVVLEEFVVLLVSELDVLEVSTGVKVPLALMELESE
jgi:hypothetical protein